MRVDLMSQKNQRSALSEHMQFLISNISEEVALNFIA